MSDYADVDETIEAWVEAAGSTLFKDWAGEPSRIFHVPGHTPNECFQVVVFPPSEGTIAVQAASIDTNDDSEFLQIWEGAIGDLNAMLETAVSAVYAWRDRSSANVR